jgi:hypothetical protein
MREWTSDGIDVAHGGAARRTDDGSGSEALASMEDVGQILGIDAEPFRSFFDRQPLANDEADRRPIQGGFGPGVVLALHFHCALHP